ncbi:MAG: anthranilate phosphoribosyltransferase [Synergistaceae bacterium]|jgi:anthranilate phosphoribosyltransferase|nr:anthranilate phosphoribosyltransferase [Synergistaceae bacterium]
MKEFGKAVTRLIKHEDLSYGETYHFFEQIMDDKPSQMHQGAFIAALSAKGASPDETLAIWKCIMDRDTNRVSLDTEKPVVDNCGTGMDSIKTFNISTASAIVASSLGAVVARHGSRGLTSACGTVDLLERLGVGVEVPVEIVKESIEKAGIGIFNGMSGQVHPQALGRILSQISFGSVLNIAASLSNPANPLYAVRGVYDKNMVSPIANLMNANGFKRAVVVCGLKENGENGIDEACTMGDTLYAEIKDGEVLTGSFSPSDFGLAKTGSDDIRGLGNAEAEENRFLSILLGRGKRAETEIVALNSALVLYVSGITRTIGQGVAECLEAIKSGGAIEKLREWVRRQNTDGAEKSASLDRKISAARAS